MSLFTDNNGNTNWKKIGYHARSAFAVLLSLAVLFAGAWFAYSKASDAYTSWKTADDYPGPGGTPVMIQIVEESTGADIANTLLDNDIIKSRKAFNKAYESNEQSKSIQAGYYKLATQIPAADAIAFLLDGQHVVRNQLTVPEGMWLDDSLALISKKTKIPVASFKKLLEDPKVVGYPSYVKDPEGFLYPETYEIGQKPTATSILKLMSTQYKAVAKTNDLVAKAEKLGRTPEEIITVASIIEGEVNKAEYLPMVASAIYNRLDDRDKLELDSTAHYGLKIPNDEPLPANFTTKDFAYNTYLYQGLPPGPIGSPGEAAIKAALNPADTDYKFWVAVNLETGETKFAKTFQQHQKNVAAFEAWCKKATDKSGCPTG